MACHVYTNEGTLARKIKNIRPEAIDLARQVKQKEVPGSGFDQAVEKLGCRNVKRAICCPQITNPSDKARDGSKKSI